MNILDFKYSKNKNNNEGENENFVHIQTVINKINDLVSEEILKNLKSGGMNSGLDKNNKFNSVNNNADALLKNLEEKIKPLLVSLEETNSNRFKSLMSSVQLIKSKVEKLQKENLELIYMKDQQSKLYENEKLNGIIFESREKDYKEEIQKLNEKFSLLERENKFLQNIAKVNKDNVCENACDDRLSSKSGMKKAENVNVEVEVNVDSNKNMEIDELNQIKSEFKSELEELKEKLENELKINLEYSRKINQLINVNEKLKETLNIFYNQKNYYEEKISNLLIENKNLNENLNKLSLKYYNFDENQNCKNNEIKSAKEELEYKEDKINKLEKKIDNLTIQMENKNNLIEELTNKFKNTNFNENVNVNQNLNNFSNNSTNNLNANNSSNLPLDKLNKLTEQNNFLSVRLNNLTSANNILTKEKENLLNLLNELKTTNQKLIENTNPECSCKNKFMEYENIITSLKFEIKNLTEEKNNFYIENQKLKFNNNDTNTNTSTQNVLSNSNANAYKSFLFKENPNPYPNYNSRPNDEKFLELFEKYTRISLNLQEKDNYIQKLEDLIKTLKTELYNIKTHILEKNEEIKFYEKQMIALNKDLLKNKIEDNEIKEKNLSMDIEYNTLNEKLKENNKYQIVNQISNEKIKTILKNKDDVIIEQGAEINNLNMIIMEKENLINYFEEDKNKFREQIYVLEHEKQKMNKLFLKYKLK